MTDVVAPPNGVHGTAAAGVKQEAGAGAGDKKSKEQREKEKKAKKKARAKERKVENKAQDATIRALVAAQQAAAATAAAAAPNPDTANGDDDTDTATAAAPAPAVTAAAANGASTPAVAYVREEQSGVSGEFAKIFEKFATPQELAERVDGIDEEEAAELEAAKAAAEAKENGGDDALERKRVEHKPAPVDSTGKKLSRKERKRKGRMEIAELKQVVARPDVVELHDTNSSDPKLLVYLKAYRNTVTVPKHWAMKRKYLQGKRGVEKPPFQLPQYIADTGIANLRGVMEEKTASKSAKGKAREKTQVKMGKLDIDYQVLHDAFFRYQTKPKMTDHGEVYYEGKELEVRHTNARPGHLSEALRNALGMQDERSPPPWLHNMQRFGPPPCYPYIKVPGVNCPIPEGARWGFGEGEWGQAPVDAFGRPLYGDVFGRERRDDDDAPIDKTLWGAIVEDEDEPPSDDEAQAGGEAGEDDDAAVQAAAMGVAPGSVSAAAAAVMASASGSGSGGVGGAESVSSQSTGVETPQAVPLRKSDGTGTETPDAVRALYTVLQEKQTSVGSAMFGTSHTYVLPTAASASGSAAEAERKIAEKKAKAAGAVDIALAPEELEGADAATLKRKYEASVAAQAKAAASARPDVSDVIAEETAKKKRKLEKDAGKKKSTFKF